jgi:glycosyltransferase involved in cell wall biosynthesis
MEAESLNEQNARKLSEKFIAGIGAYPGDFKGKGIIIAGGGVCYFTNAWVCINMLRRFGCQLPVQVWYLGQKEMDERMKDILRPLGVDFVDAFEVRQKHPARILNGWEVKPYAIIHSPFEEILYLDADNVPIVNPEFLFDTPEYKETGALFWPDFGRLERGRMIWNICGVPYRDEPEFETGQMVLHKEKCWSALALCMWYNEYSDFYYDHIHGDKETFHMAFRKLKKTYAMPSRPIDALEETMCQHDFEGRRIFQHRNCDKWDFFNNNKEIEGFLFEHECRTYISELRKKWDGQIANPMRYNAEKKTESEKAIAQALTDNVYVYERIGFDSRGISFSADGSIGVGTAGCESLWDIKEVKGEAVLTISSEKRVTCNLKRDSEGIWRGKWLVFEQMPIELTLAGRADEIVPGQAGAGRVVLRAPLNVYTGYGLHASRVIGDLAGMGYEIAVRSTELSEIYGQIPPDIRRRLVAAVQTDNWELLLFPPRIAPTPGKKTLFFTMWEATKLPPNGVQNLNAAECIVVPSHWNASCFSAGGVEKPIRVVPLGINTQVFKYAPMNMEGPCVFGTGGRTESGGMRKGFREIVEAFQKAFPKEADVELWLKAFPDCKMPEVRDHRIKVIKKFMSEEELAAWFASLTCFVSGSKSEGWGLMQHQALAVGRPLVSVKFGGVAEYFTEEIGYPTNFQLKPAEGPYAGCGHWAELDGKHLMSQLRRVYENREDARERGLKGAISVSRFSWEESNRKLVHVMREIGMVNVLVKRGKPVSGKVITMVLFRRPGYTKQVIEALRSCDGIQDYLICPRIEPESEEVITLARGIDFAEVRVTINKRVLGCGLNTFCSWQDGFKLADFVIHVEDDTVPAPDCLRFMEHCRDAYARDQEIFSVASYNKEGYDPAKLYQLARRSKYTCWLVGIWGDRWEWAKGKWNRDPKAYAAHLDIQRRAKDLKEVYPVLSRSQNIGAVNGVHVPSAEWHRNNHHTEHWAGLYGVKPGTYHE